MELYIRIVDGQPFEHPILGDNFRQAFPDLDINNLPPQFAKFERVPEPNKGAYEVADGPVYQWVNGIVKDVWAVRPMTPEEKTETITLAKKSWHPENFVFNEEQCRWEPPELSNPGAAPNVID